MDSNLREFRFRLNRNANEDSTAKKTVSTIVQNEPGTAETLSEHNSEITNSTTLRAREIKVHEEQVTKGTETAVSTSGAPKTTGRSNLATEHEWLNCMERFAGCMDIFWKRTLETAHQSLGQDQDDTRSVNIDIQTRKDLQKDVVVALIDDGVDSCDPAFAGRVIEGKTFDYQDGGVGQYYISAKSHGTEMARMILKVCPMANIYSIRLKTHTSPDKGHSTIDAVSAALASLIFIPRRCSLANTILGHRSCVGKESNNNLHVVDNTRTHGRK